MKVPIHTLPTYLTMASENGVDGPLPEHSKYFLRHWTVTVPSYPSLRFYRATPALFDAWVPIMTEPKNSELQDTQDKIWDEAAIAEWKEKTEDRYHKSNRIFEPLGLLIEYEGNVVGYGDVWPTTGQSTSVGILLNQAVRGRGIGKIALIVLVQIAFDFGLPINSGTMKANVAWRGLMASFGIPEEEKLVTDPDRGVLAEVVYQIERENWKEVEMEIEFDEGAVIGKEDA